MSGAPSGGRRRFDLREREPSVIEKGAPRGGQFNAVHAAVHQRNADLVFEIADLGAQRWLRRVQPLLGGDRQASCLRDGDKIAKVT
jgi:hypothetical protein